MKSKGIRKMGRIQEILLFFRGFLEEPLKVSSVVPSSFHLANQIIQTAHVPEASVIVELGCGSGSITERVKLASKPDAIFISLDTSKSFADMTRKRCPGVEVINRSALELKEILKERGLKNCDSIVSGIPWVSLRPEVQKEMLEVVHSSLKPGGYFATLAFTTGMFSPSSLRFKNLLKKKFISYGESRIVWRNFPPAIVIWGRKK
jgi:phospholipid N-methyltransferase